MNLHEVPRESNVGRRIRTLDNDFTRSIGIGEGAFGVCVYEDIRAEEDLGTSNWLIRMESHFYNDEDGNPNPTMPREDYFYPGEFEWL